MKKELVDLQPKLEQAKIENTHMMKVNNVSCLCLSVSSINHLMCLFYVTPFR